MIKKKWNLSCKIVFCRNLLLPSCDLLFQTTCKLFLFAPPGQGFADKRKRKAINRYLKLRRKGVKETFTDGGRERNESIQGDDNATGVSTNQSETELHHMTPSSPSKDGGNWHSKNTLATEKSHSQAKM